MADQEMYDSLTDTIADYTSVTLSVSCQVELTETGDKHQVLHEFDDGSIDVVSISDTSFFDVELQWPNGITTSDAGIIRDLWHNISKANGRENTIYWEHPIDGHTYVIRFMGPLTYRWIAGMVGYVQIPVIPIRIEGRKAEA